MTRRLTRDELVDLADSIIKQEVIGEDLDRAVALFKENIKDPSVLDLIFWSDDPISAEEVVERGLNPAAKRAATGIVDPLHPFKGEGHSWLTSCRGRRSQVCPVRSQAGFSPTVYLKRSVLFERYNS